MSRSRVCASRSATRARASEDGNASPKQWAYITTPCASQACATRSPRASRTASRARPAPRLRRRSRARCACRRGRFRPGCGRSARSFASGCPVSPEDVAALRPWILAYTKRRVPRSDVEDVAHEVLVQALQSLPSFVPSTRAHALRRWVAGIARRCAAMYWRALRYSRRYERDRRAQFVRSPEEPATRRARNWPCSGRR